MIVIRCGAGTHSNRLLSGCHFLHPLEPGHLSQYGMSSPETTSRPYIGIGYQASARVAAYWFSGRMQPAPEPVSHAIRHSKN